MIVLCTIGRGCGTQGVDGPSGVGEAVSPHGTAGGAPSSERMHPRRCSGVEEGEEDASLCPGFFLSHEKRETG